MECSRNDGSKTQYYIVILDRLQGRSKGLEWALESWIRGSLTATASQNRFEVLRSRVMQCGVKERMIRRQKVTVVEWFKCGEKGHKCRECPEWRKTKEERRVRRVEEAVFVAMPQKAQQKKRPACPTREEVQEWQKSLMAVLQQRAQEHCKEGIPKEAQLLELRWSTQEMIVSYLVCERYGKKECYIEENRGQEVISRKRLEEMK